MVEQEMLVQSKLKVEGLVELMKELSGVMRVEGRRVTELTLNEFDMLRDDGILKEYLPSAGRKKAP